MLVNALDRYKAFRCQQTLPYSREMLKTDFIICSKNPTIDGVYFMKTKSYLLVQTNFYWDKPSFQLFELSELKRFTLNMKLCTR